MRGSMSKTALILSGCTAWMGDAAVWYRDEFANTTKRDLGTNFHSCMEMYVASGSRELAYMGAKSEQVKGWLDLAIVWYNAHLKPRCESIRAEVYVAYDFTTGKVHSDQDVRNREYPDMPGLLPGTSDLVAVLRDGTLYVGDWKTGGSSGAREQLLSLGIGLRNLPEYHKPDGTKRSLRLCIIRVTDEGILPEEWDPTEDELESHHVAMHVAMHDSLSPEVPGIHCTQLYCPHLAHCKAMGSVAEDASEGAEGLLPVHRLTRKYDIAAEPSNPQHAGYIMERVTAVKRQIDYWEKRVRKYVEDGGRCIAGEYEFSKGRDGFRWRKQ